MACSPLLKMKKPNKYLFYDNIVRGAGLGHSLSCYNYGLNMALGKGLEFLPCRIQAGHGFKDGAIESLLGLPESQKRRDFIIQADPSAVEHVRYCPTDNGTSHDLTATRSILRRWYYESRKEYDTMLSKDHNVANITICIRRGDIACGLAHPMQGRLRPNRWYVAALEKNNITIQYIKLPLNSF